MKNYSNDIDAIEKLIKEVVYLPNNNDFLEFEIRGLETINEVKEYHGIRVNLTGIIGRTRTPFSIDFGVGDIIVPSAVERTLPVLLTEFEATENHDGSFNSHSSGEDMCASLYGRARCFHHLVAGLNCIQAERQSSEHPWAIYTKK